MHVDDEVEVEGIDDADLVAHMQMRLSVDLPLHQPQAPQEVSSVASSEQMKHEPFVTVSDASKSAIAPWIDSWGQAGIGAKLVVTGISISLLLLGAALGAILRSCGERLKGGTSKEAPGQKVLTTAHEPAEATSAELKPKKIPPVVVESDSPDTDEDEPEAEQSESEEAAESGDSLEEVVFQAAQVEVANQISEDHYGNGSTPYRELIDQILH